MTFLLSTTSVFRCVLKRHIPSRNIPQVLCPYILRKKDGICAAQVNFSSNQMADSSPPVVELVKIR